MCQFWHLTIIIHRIFAVVQTLVRVGRIIFVGLGILLFMYLSPRRPIVPALCYVDSLVLLSRVAIDIKMRKTAPLVKHSGLSSY